MVDALELENLRLALILRGYIYSVSILIIIARIETDISLSNAVRYPGFRDHSVVGDRYFLKASVRCHAAHFPPFVKIQFFHVHLLLFPRFI